MITWMQKHRKYLVVTIWISTIAFVGAGFVGWGAYNYNQKRSGAVALVGERKITVQDFNSAYSNIYNYYQDKLKGTLTKEKAKSLGLENAAMSQLISQALMLNYADELGLTTLDSEVENSLKSTKAFQNNGVFNKEQYYRVLANIGVRPKEYEESLKKEITLKKLNDILSLNPTDLEKETFGASLFMQDRLAIKIIYPNIDKIDLSDKVLKNFWEKRKKSYLTDKTYTLSIIKVPISFINVDENETKEYYNKKRYAYTDKDGKILSYEDAKEKVVKDLQFKKGKRFALKQYLALKKGKIKASDTVTISVKDRSYPQKTLKTASKGDVIKPFRYNDQYIIAKVENIDLPKPMSFDEAKNRVKRDYAKIATKKELEKEAKNMLNNNAPVSDIGFVSRDDIKKIKSLSPLEAIDFLTSVFNSNKEKGYFVFNDKAIIYKVLEQKLLDKNKLKTYDKLLSDNVKNIKINETNQKLLSVLKNKYKIERYYKGQ